MMKSWMLTGVAGIAVIAALTPAAAQEAPTATQSASVPAQPSATQDDQPGEIIVTAQKREERLQDVPVAVSVVSGAAIANQGGVNLENVQYLVPALNVRKSGTPLNQSLYMRGVGTQSASIAFEPSVSTVLDGVVLSRAGEAFSDLVDIERIEVLRGPQGTLFGKNTSAGVVNIVSKRPGRDFGGYVEGGWYFGEGNEYRIRGAADLPFGEKARSRVTAFYGTYDGNIINETFDKRVNGYEHYGVRGLIELEPAETVTITLIGDWRKSDDDCCGEVIAAPARDANNTPNAAFLNRAAVALPPLRGSDTRRLRQNLITRYKEKSWGLSGQADVEIGTHVLTAITSYRKYDNREIRDGDFLDRPYVGIAQSHDDGPQTGNTFTQELRITSPGDQRLTYVAGLFYSRAESERTFTRSNIACSASTLPAIGAGLVPCSTAPGASTLTFPIGIANFGVTFKNLAAFGQANLELTDALSLIAGLRYTHDKVNGFHIRTTPVPGASNPPFDQGVFDSVSPAFPAGNPAAANGVPFRQGASEDNLSGKAGVQYEFSPATTAYFTYSRGYKGPALNIFFNLAANGTPIIDAEKADAFELGLKNSLFGGRLILNLAAYYAKYKNFQANNPDFVLGQRVTRFTNAGTVSTRGFEIEAIARPARDLNIGGSLAYTDAKVDDFRLPPGANPADRVPNGTPLAYAPKWKAALGGDYRWRTDSVADVAFSLQGSYQSRQLSLFVGNPISRANGYIKDYGLVDASIGLITPDDRFSLTFQVKNIFNTSFAASISDGGPLSAGNTGSSSYRYIIPREADRYFGLIGRVNF